MKIPHLLLVILLPWAVVADDLQNPPNVLTASATTALATSLKASTAHAKHVWRDTPPTNPDGTVNAYIEIASGDRRKWDFDMRTNVRAIDRVIPSEVGGYPVNYGFVPQTISYDGDPFDVLVLGPPLPGGHVVQGVVVGVMFMQDEKGLDSKVVVSLPDPKGRPIHALTAQVQQEIGDYFRRYKQHEPGAFSKVPGWGATAHGHAYVSMTHAFFKACRAQAGASCTIKQ